MNDVSTVIQSDLPDVSVEPLAALVESDDTWLRRAVDRIRSEATSADPTFPKPASFAVTL